MPERAVGRNVHENHDLPLQPWSLLIKGTQVAAFSQHDHQLPSRTHSFGLNFKALPFREQSTKVGSTVTSCNMGRSDIGSIRFSQDFQGLPLKTLFYYYYY